MNDPVRQEIVGLALSLAGAVATAVEAVACASVFGASFAPPSRIHSKILATRDELHHLTTDAQLLTDYLSAIVSDGEGHHFRFGEPVLFPKATLSGFRKLAKDALNHCRVIHLLAIDLWHMSPPEPAQSWLDVPTHNALEPFNQLPQAGELGNVMTRLRNAIGEAREFVDHRLQMYSQSLYGEGGEL